jgi:hypothetical protein
LKAQQRLLDAAAAAEDFDRHRQQAVALLTDGKVRRAFDVRNADGKARDRFEVKVPAGKAEAQLVTEERVIAQNFQVSNSDDNTIRVWLNSPVTSAKVEKGLQEALELRGAAAETQRDIAEM